MYRADLSQILFNVTEKRYSVPSLSFDLIEEFKKLSKVKPILMR